MHGLVLLDLLSVAVLIRTVQWIMSLAVLVRMLRQQCGPSARDRNSAARADLYPRRQYSGSGRLVEAQALETSSTSVRKGSQTIRTADPGQQVVSKAVGMRSKSKNHEIGRPTCRKVTTVSRIRACRELPELAERKSSQVEKSCKWQVI